MRFPGHEKVKFHKGVPEGWQTKKIGDIVKVRYGYTETAIRDDGFPKYVRVMDINKRSFIDWYEVPNCPINEGDFEKYKLEQMDIVMARMASPGRVAIIERDISSVFASYLIKLIPSLGSVSPYFLFYTLSSPNYQGMFSNADTSATRGSINGQVVSAFQIILPPVNLQYDFDQVVTTLRRKMNILLEQNRNASISRDFLLSRLITGKLSVENLDIKFPPSMLNPESAEDKEANG